MNLDEEAQRKNKVLIRSYDRVTIGPKEEILLNDLMYVFNSIHWIVLTHIFDRKQISDWRNEAKPGDVLEMPNLTGFQRLLAYQEVDHR